MVVIINNVESVLFTCFASLMRSTPSKIVRVHTEQRFTILGAFHVLLDKLGSDTDHMLTLPILHHVQGLECADNVLLSEACHCTACEYIGQRVMTLYQ